MAIAKAERSIPNKGEDFRKISEPAPRGKGWQLVLQASTIIGIIALTALLLNIIDGAFGYVASPEQRRSRGSGPGA